MTYFEYLIIRGNVICEIADKITDNEDRCNIIFTHIRLLNGHWQKEKNTLHLNDVAQIYDLITKLRDKLRDKL